MGTTGPDKSLPMIKNFSASGGIKVDEKKSAAFPGDIEVKNSFNNSKIPRLQVKVSSSLNNNLNVTLGKGKVKKVSGTGASSKTTRQNETEPSPAVNSTKELFVEINVSDAETKKSEGEPEENAREKETSDENENRLEGPEANRSNSLKPSADLAEVKNEESVTSYKDAEEQASPASQASRATFKKGVQEKQMAYAEEREKEKQEKMIGYLYETLKCTAGSVFEGLGQMKEAEAEGQGTCPGETSTDEKTHCEPVPDFSTIQEHYEFTLREISNIWRNAMSLIVCVKEHTVKFVEENSRAVDREQLTLEAEMLQLAIDFAISYSKLKTDFLIKSVKKCLNVKDSGKTELETFMDSKIFTAVYSNDDLSEMARTVQELRRSVVKENNAEVQ